MPKNIKPLFSPKFYNKKASKIKVIEKPLFLCRSMHPTKKKSPLPI